MALENSLVLFPLEKKGNFFIKKLNFPLILVLTNSIWIGRLWKLPDLLTKEHFWADTEDRVGGQLTAFICLSLLLPVLWDWKKAHFIKKVIWWTSQGWIEKECGFQSQNFRKNKGPYDNNRLFVYRVSLCTEYLKTNLLICLKEKKDYNGQIFGYKKPCYISVRKKIMKMSLVVYHE